MNRKRKIKRKFFLPISVSLCTTSFIIGSSVLYFFAPSIERVSEKGFYVLRQNSPLLEGGYKYDLSAANWNAKTNTVGVLISNNLIHLKSEGKLKLDENNKVIQPSFQSYEFSLAESVVVQFQNKHSKEWMELIFDNDDAEITNFDKNNNEIVIEKKSKNPKSINNKNIFLKLLSTGALSGNKIDDPSNIIETNIINSGNWIIKKVGFTIRPGIKWVNSNGKQTKYNLVVDDFWYSFMRSRLYDKNFRRENGGHKELDNYFIKKSKTIFRFGEDHFSRNDSVFDFFDIDVNKLYSRETAIQKTLDNSKEFFAFTITDNVEITSGFISIFNKFLLNDLQFSAAPSEFIKELASSEKINNVEDLKIKSLAREFGIYTYGQTRQDVLFASPYVPVIVSENREVYEYNKFFANKKWVSSVENGDLNEDGNTYKAIKKIIYEYTNGVDSSTYSTQLLSSYLQGTVSEIQYSELSDSQRIKIYGNNSDINEIEKEIEKNGLQKSKFLNTTSVVQRLLPVSNPINNVKDINSYGFNNNYSELVFGLSLNDLLIGDKTTTNNFFVNQGLDFRLLIQSAINWDAFIRQSFSNQRIMWLNNAAQNAKFTSKLNSKTPIDYYEEVNTVQFIDYTDKTFSYKLISITPEDMKKHSERNINNNEVQMQSPQFEKIKINIKLLLDDFYKLKKLNSDDKIEWEIVYPWSDKNTLKLTILNNAINTIKKLDNRLNPKLLIPNDKKEMINKIFKYTSISNSIEALYDYEGIGSYLINIFQHQGIGILNSLSFFSKKNPIDNKMKFLQTNYTEFTKLAKFIKNETDARMKKLNIDKKYWIENWDKITNKENQNLTNFFKEKTNLSYDLYSELLKILKKYEDTNVTDEELASLLKEINSIKGISFSADNSILDPNTASLFLYLKEYVIPVNKHNINYFEDYRYKVKV